MGTCRSAATTTCKLLSRSSTSSSLIATNELGSPPLQKPPIHIGNKPCSTLRTTSPAQREKRSMAYSDSSPMTEMSEIWILKSMSTFRGNCAKFLRRTSTKCDEKQYSQLGESVLCKKVFGCYKTVHGLLSSPASNAK